MDLEEPEFDKIDDDNVRGLAGWLLPSVVIVCVIIFALAVFL